METVKKLAALFIRILKFFVIWFALSLVFIIPASTLFPANENNVAYNGVGYFFYALAMLIVPVLAGIKFSKPKAKEKVEDDFSAEFRLKVSAPASNTPLVEDFGSDGSHDDFKIPFSKSKRNALARNLFLEVQSYAEVVNKTRSVSEFFTNFDRMISTLRKAEKLDGKATNLKGSLLLDRIRIESEFQKHIHDLLDRSSKEIVSEYKGVYKYDKGYIERRIQAFKTDCDLNLSRMDTANQGYANALFLYLCNECKAIELLCDPEEEATPGRPVSTITDFGDYELLKIDTMEAPRL